MKQKNETKKYNHREGSLIQVLLLRIIYEAPSYGYEIIDRVARFTSSEHTIKTGTAYTLLRRMEEKGLVRSNWEKNEAKHDKRMYTITPAGVVHLKTWLEFIMQRKVIINKLTRFYDAHFKEEQPKKT